MKYLKEWTNGYIFNALFYEVENRTVYTFCPNCGNEDTIKLNNKKTSTSIKEFYIPKCGCFDRYIGCHGRSAVNWYHSSYKHKKLKERYTAAEFRYFENKLHIDIYFIHIDLSSDERAFKRLVDPYAELCVTAEYDLNRGKIKYKSCVSSFMSAVYTTEWRTVKRFPTYIRNYDFMKESFKELLNTNYGKYIPILNNISEEVSNISNNCDDVITATMETLFKYNSAYLLYKAGFKSLFKHKILEILYLGHTKYYNPFINYYRPSHNSKGIVNYKAKTVKNALKRFDINVLDNLFERKDLAICDLIAVKRLQDSKLKITSDNLKIIAPSRSENLLKLIKVENLDCSKVFKYMRNQCNKKQSLYPSIAGDYYDYLMECKTLSFDYTTEVLYPTSLVAAHKRTSLAVREAQKVAADERFSEAVKKYLGLNFENENYLLEVVKSNFDLFDYSKKFKNCSYGYQTYILSGTCLICVVKSIKSGKALSMIELNLKDKTIVQNRRPSGTKGQPKASAKVQQFSEQWLNTIAKNYIEKVQKKEKKYKQAS